MSKPDITGRNVFIAGGTSGIGQAVALNLASRGCNVTIAGRNEKLCQQTVAECRSQSPIPDTADIEYMVYDATSIASSKSLMERACVKYDNMGGLHYLFLTTGGLTNGYREETEEGYEKYFALQVLSRYIIAAGLCPQLSRVQGSVWNVMAGAMGDKFDLEDFQLKKPKTYGLVSVATRDSGIWDVLTMEFNRRHPEIWFNHIYPGMVNTGGSGKQNLNFIIDFVLRYVVWLFGWTPTAYAENLMTTIDDNDRSIHYWHPKSKKVTPKPWTQDEGVAKKVLEEMEKDTGVGMYGI